jgi:phospholipase C
MSMPRRRVPALTTPLIAVLVALIAGLSACGGGGSSSTTPPPPPPTYAQKFKHVVVIFQENRSPDNLFHGFPNADIADSGVNSAGQSIPLTQIDLANDYDLSHAHPAFVDMYDGGKMDGADKIPISCTVGAVNCPPPNPQFMYVNPTEVQPYFQMGEQYTFGDRMFQTNHGPSFPAHQFIISGTSAPTATSDLFAAENPFGGAGCDAAVGSLVTLIDPLGNENQQIYPCFEHPTLLDSLDAQAITWRYYAPDAGSIWTGPNAIQHIRSGADWANVIIPQTQVLTDIANNQLAQVTWVIPDGADSEGQQGHRPVVGGIYRQRHRHQPLLVRYRRHHYLGRLGRLVRPCRAVHLQFLRIRFSRSAHHRIALHETGIRFSRDPRFWQHLEIY